MPDGSHRRWPPLGLGGEARADPERLSSTRGVEGSAATRRARRTLALVPIVVTVAAAVGCGGSSTGPMEPAPRPEANQRLPALPHGWRPHRDRSMGYAIGIP